MAANVTHSGETILVEVAEASGLQGAAASPPVTLEEAATRSAEAIERVMASVQKMATGTAATMRAIEKENRPDAVEIAFSLKVDAQGRAWIARGDAEAAFRVRLVWQREPETVPMLPHVSPPAPD